MVCRLLSPFLAALVLGSFCFAAPVAKAAQQAHSGRPAQLTNAERAQVHAYAAEMSDHEKRFTQCMSDIVGLLGHENDNDKAWTSAMGVQLTKLSALTQEGERIKAPAICQPIQAEYARSMREYSYVPAEMTRLIHNHDKSQLDKITSHMTKGREYRTHSEMMAQQFLVRYLSKP